MKKIFSVLLISALLLCSGCVPSDQEAVSSQDPIDAQNILYTEEDSTVLPNGKSKIDQIDGKLDGIDASELIGSEKKEVGNLYETYPGDGYIPMPEPVEPPTETE